MIYVVETKDTVWWSDRKLDAVYKHTAFRRPQAKFRELTQRQFNSIKKQKVAL